MKKVMLVSLLRAEIGKNGSEGVKIKFEARRKRQGFG